MLNLSKKHTLALALTALCFILNNPSIHAQGLRFAKGFTNSTRLGGAVSGRGMVTDNAGNQYMTGYFSLGADFDPGPGSLDLVANGNQDIFFAKYDPSGNVVYAKSMGSASADLGQAIAIDASGNVYITGSFNGTVDFDPGPGTANLTSNGSDEGFLAKYDASGNYVWAFSIGGTGYDGGYGIGVDASANVYVTGYFQSTVDFDPGAGTASLTASGNDIFVAKYTASGNYLFAIKAGGTSSDYAYALTLDASANVYITGYFGGNADFDPGAGVANLTSAGGVDAFVAKYDASGNYVYAKGMGGSSSDCGYGIGVDASGSVSVTGYFQGTADFDPGAGTVSLVSNGGYDAFIARYDASGNYVYARPIGGSSSDYGQAVAVDASGNAYVSGYFSTTSGFDRGVSTVDLTSAGGNDIFVAKYDASGNYVYAKGIGSTGTDVGFAIALDAAGAVYVTGYFNGTVDFDPGAGVTALTSGNSINNSYLLKLSSSGNFTYVLQQGVYASNQLSDVGQAVVTDASGNVYVTGSFMGTVDFDPGVGVTNLTASSNSDVFIAKYNAMGNLLFANSVGGSGYDYGYGITLDGSGNIYVTGIASGTVDFDPGPGTANVVYPGSNDAVFIAKYNSAGNYIYAKGIAGTSAVTPQSIAVDGSGNVYITGYFTGTTDFDPDAGTANLTSAGSNDIFFAKYDVNGAYLFANRIGSTSADNSNSIALDASGSIYIAGSFQGTVDFDPGAGTTNLTSAGSADAFFAKYDASGNLVFAKSLGSTGSDMVRGILLDPAGNIYLAGLYTGTVNFDPAGTANRTAVGSNDAFLAKYDASGNFVFANSIGGSGSDFAYASGVDGLGNVYVTGFFNGTADFDPGAGTANLTSAGVGDVYLAKYDPSGNYVSARRMGGTSNDVGYGLSVGPTGNVTVVGTYQNAADFDPGSGNTAAVVNGINSGDFFLAQYGSPITLPVRLLNFTAVPAANGETVLVNWSTASETNNSYFDVERSSDGSVFAAIGRKPGCTICSSIQTYNFKDNSPVNGVSYYRLKQVDIDGKATYSDLVPVRIGKDGTVLFVYPAVTEAGFSIMVKNNPMDKLVSYTLVSASGSLVKTGTAKLGKGDARIDMNLSDAAPGVYYIRVADAFNHAYSLKVIKN